MKSTAILFAVVFFISKIFDSKCETLKTLLMEKYHKQLNPGMFTEIQKINGQEFEVSFGPLPSPERRVFDNPENVSILEQFENNPAAVYNNKNLRPYVVTRIVKDYESNPLSRKIVLHCLEFCTDPEYIKMLLKAAVEFDATSLIEKIIASYPITLAEPSYEIEDQHNSFTDTVVRLGKFHIAKSFFLRGIVMDPPATWIETIMRYSSLKNIDGAKDFLEFLVVRMQLFDINSINYGRQTVLHQILSRPAFTEADSNYKTLFAQYFVHLGANPMIPDGMGRTALEIAAKQNINI